MSKESDQLVKSALAAIRKEVGAEALEKISSHLKTIEREFDDVFDDVKEFLNESVKRKETIREKEREIEKLNEQISKSKDTSAFDAMKKERDDLKGQVDSFKKVQADADKQKRETFVGSFDQYKDHADFAKVKPFLKIPEEVDGKLDWSKSTAEDINHNLSELEKARAYGSFGDVKIPKPGDSKVPDPKDKTKDPFAAFPGPK